MKKLLLVVCCALLAAACTVVDRTREARLDAGARWVLLPMVNHTETPQAGLRAEAITETLLRGLGVAQLERYPATLSPDALFDPAERKAQDQALAWAKERKARFAVSGSVEEWRYKVGVDGEPAVGLSLSILDLDSGAVVYAASGAKSGWSREALSAVAQKLARELLAGIQLGR
ncbi:MAG: penicillin-binding protein activator LpoB [Betaproteobacteria bacterium]